MEDCKLQVHSSWALSEGEHPSIPSQTTFFTLNSDFKFMVIASINKPIKLLTIEGRLIHNNGSTVFINTGHQSFVHHYLNDKFDPIKKRIIFAIDQSLETLTFTAKMSNISDIENANKIAKLCEGEVLARKKSILYVIAIVGVPLDAENALMRKMLIEKKKLKNKLEEILKHGNDKEDYSQKEMLLESEDCEEDEGGVIYFGENTNYVLEETMVEEDPAGKKFEGGYFSIVPSNNVIKNTKTGKIISRKLVMKTLKEKRRSKDEGNNSVKMKKELETVQSIKNKKYLIRYYCDIKDLDNITEVYMDQYQHSLQEYVHYLGDSVEFLQKINISKQIVDAILSLHHSNVIHRDIKPANFLIDDLSGNANTYKIKIIDFAESYSKNITNYNIDYACSHPYSPLECIDKKGFNEKGPMQGIGNKEIDYWSVGVTIYEIFFRKLPVSFSRAFLVDITSSWKTELLLAVNQREKIGFSLAEDIINIICIKMMKFSQDQRMNLYSTKKILESLESYLKNLLQILEEIV